MMQKEPLQKAYDKLGHWLSWTIFGNPVPTIAIDEMIATINLARPESSSTDEREPVKVVRKLRAMAQNEWVRRPTDDEIRDLLALAADHLEKETVTA